MTTSASAGAPPGYARRRVGTAELVARTPLIETCAEALREGSLYEYAEHHAQARPLPGRGVAYAVPLPDGCTRVVVRRSRHGGFLAALTGERFLPPTRAPHELDVALRLSRLAIPTPELVAYARYPAGAVFRRADVLTREIPDAADLDVALVDAPDDQARATLLAAVADLLRQLGGAGVRHPDLNLKNVLMSRDENGGVQAMIIDVDRVWFDEPGSPSTIRANFRRFARSARKRRERHGTPIDERDLTRIAIALDLGDASR